MGAKEAKEGEKKISDKRRRDDSLLRGTARRPSQKSGCCSLSLRVCV